MDDELTPEALDAWNRWVEEVDRRSRACAEAAATNWGAVESAPRKSPDAVRINP